MEPTESFRAIVMCEDTGNEVVAEFTVMGSSIDILHLHNDDTYDTTDSEDVEAFRAKFYEQQAGVIVN